MRKKKDLQNELDRIRQNPRSFKKGTKEFNKRIQLEQQIDAGLYDKDK